MDESSLDALRDVRAVVAAARAGTAEPGASLRALAELRLLREELATWEPELITAARERGASWAELAPALGVASRQAAERRYLRLRPSGTGETTGEARVEAERGRRAGDRAVASWARQNSASLRKLAGRVSALGDLGAEARRRADKVGDALADDDAANLLPPLAAAQPHLTGHGALADELATLTEHTDRIRRDAEATRRERSK